MNVDETALLPILKAIQKLEPTGVGARNLKECLIIQLEHKTTSRSVELAKHILSKQDTAFANKNFEKLIREFEVNENQLKDAYKEIEQLNPKPGASFNNSEDGNTYISSDFTLELEDEDLRVILTRANPNA